MLSRDHHEGRQFEVKRGPEAEAYYASATVLSMPYHESRQFEIKRGPELEAYYAEDGNNQRRMLSRDHHEGRQFEIKRGPELEAGNTRVSMPSHECRRFEIMRGPEPEDAEDGDYQRNRSFTQHHEHRQFESKRGPVVIPVHYSRRDKEMYHDDVSDCMESLMKTMDAYLERERR